MWLAYSARHGQFSGRGYGDKVDELYSYTTIAKPFWARLVVVFELCLRHETGEPVDGLTRLSKPRPAYEKYASSHLVR